MLTLVVLGLAQPASAQISGRRYIRQLLVQAQRSHWVGFAIVGGRIQSTAYQSVNINSSSSVGPGGSTSERLTVQINGEQRTIDYEAKGKDEITIASKNADDLRMRRVKKDTSETLTVELVQAPRAAITFSYGTEGKMRQSQAQSLWLLLLAQDADGRTQLVELLDHLRNDWRMGERLAGVEDELLRLASSGQLPDRSHWAELVTQLADDRFARREAADRELRSAGPAVLGYLRRIDLGKLDAEQQSRIQRIIAAQGQEAEEDSAATVASSLVLDPEAWLVLLDRPDETIRRQAAGQLGRLLGRTIAFDPAADNDTRRRQIEALRTTLPK